MKKAGIKAIAYYLPNDILSNADLALVYPEWSEEKITEKLGIRERHIAAKNECSSDLALQAAERLFAATPGLREKVDYLLLCTQSPDYFLPTTACLLQQSLRLSTCIGALDFNLGCSGFVYGLGLTKGLIETGQAQNVLLITAETYSKFISTGDKSVRTLFGDGAAATLVSGEESKTDLIGPFVYGTDGSGGTDLMVPSGGMRNRLTTHKLITDQDGSTRTDAHLRMNGPAIFTFTLRVVGQAVEQLLIKAGLQLSDIDLFVFHQANKYMLDYLRNKLGIPSNRFVVCIEHCGNTVSSTIPIALSEALRLGQAKIGQRIMLVGFGVGLSWGGVVVTL